MTETTVSDLLPTPPVSSAAPAVDLPEGSAPLPVAPPLLIDVVWGHLARTPGDIHVTGHYLGVMPTAAERALDEAISVPGGRQLIAEHTRRRWLVGALGEVSYFPGHTPGGTGDSLVVRAAVAGMGRVGTFSESNAVRLYASLVRELAGWPASSTRSPSPSDRGRAISPSTRSPARSSWDAVKDWLACRQRTGACGRCRSWR